MGETDPGEEEEDHSLMATAGPNTNAGDRDEAEGDESDQQHDPLTGRFLPELPGDTTHHVNLMQLEGRGGETSRAMLSYLDWLRTYRTYWRLLQGPLVEELQAAILSASLQSCMLAQPLIKGVPGGRRGRGPRPHPLQRRFSEQRRELWRCESTVTTLED